MLGRRVLLHKEMRCDVYRIHDLVKTVKVWPEVAILKYVSSPRMETRARGDVDGEMRQRGGRYMAVP